VKVFLSGATGFIGTPLVRSLSARGDECLVLSRSSRDPWQNPRVRIVRGNPAVAGAWEREVDGADVVVNLAGERIVDPPKRWTTERKRALRASRLESTHNIVTAVRSARRPPRALINASAIGYYGGRGDETCIEGTPPGTDFLAALCTDWEAAAAEAADRARVVMLRSGVVLGKDGGGLAPLFWLFRLGMGGPWGDGRQWWSWIHLVDEIRLIQFLVDHDVHGPVNLSSPGPVRVSEFAAAVGKVLHRPAAVRAPEFALRLALGEAADALLNLQRVLPRKALESGFEFQFPAIEPALRDIFDHK
jgi:uncharacterized protein (TIGR01777 family)